MDIEPTKDGEYKTLAMKASSLIREVKCNLQEVIGEFRALRSSDPTSNTTQPPATCGGDLLTVAKGDMDRLATETMMMKEFLPLVLSPDLLSSLSKLTQREQELQSMMVEKEETTKEVEQLKRRNEALRSDYEQEKQEKFTAKCEVNGLQQQLSQQADYCTSMGAACCTLLWRVSRHEECVHSILSGAKVSEFLQLGTNTLQSYLDTYAGSLPSETSLESQFILALCGTITNVAASAYGRDFLSSCEEGLALIDVFCSALAEAPIEVKCSKMRRLMLMTLYNISINQKGLKYLTSKPALMRVLVWLIQEETDVTNRLHSMRLLQSLIMEPESPVVVHQALEAIPMALLEHLSTQDPNQEVRSTAVELMADLSALQSFQS